jgi:FkbM family methyltransferase
MTHRERRRLWAFRRRIKMEIIRRSIRAVMGSDSAVYRMASQALSFSLVTVREGPGMARRLWRLSRTKAGQPEILKFRNLRHAIAIRPGTSDARTAINNFIREDYGFVRPSVHPVSMVDAGAYIGDTSAYFLSRYPQLRIAALEPDPANFEMARKNLVPYGDGVLIYNKALSSRPGSVFMSGQYDGACISNSGVQIEATTLPAVMSAMGWDLLSVLKLDIEGEEANVLDEDAEAWLGKVGLIIVEPHGSAIEAKIRPILERNNFSVQQYRGCWFCHNKGQA